MEDSKTLLMELFKKFNNAEIKKDLLQAGKYYSEQAAANNSTKEMLANNAGLFQRKNSQIEAEIQRLMLAQARNNEQYSKKNNERLKLAKKIIDLEQKNEALENEIARTEALIAAKEEEINSINCPSPDALYYEIVKGFNVDFVKRQGALHARVKNREKNDVYQIELSEDRVAELCNEIWELME